MDLLFKLKHTHKHTDTHKNAVNGLTEHKLPFRSASFSQVILAKPLISWRGKLLWTSGTNWMMRKNESLAESTLIWPMTTSRQHVGWDSRTPIRSSQQCFMRSHLLGRNTDTCWSPPWRCFSSASSHICQPSWLMLCFLSAQCTHAEKKCFMLSETHKIAICNTKLFLLSLKILRT